MAKELLVDIVETRLLAAAVADEVVASVADVIGEKGSCSLVLSGGSTPATIYRTLSRPPRVTEVEWEKLRIYWGDERWVPPDDDHSNYRMAHETLISNLADPGPGVFRVDTSVPTPADAAQAYASLISENEPVSKNGSPELDIVLLGIGEDGHFASIFPGSSLLDGDPLEGKDPVAVVETNPDGQERISISPASILRAKNIFIIVKSDKKAKIVREVLEGSEPCTVYPARVLQKAEGVVHWFVESAAARQLEKYS